MLQTKEVCETKYNTPSLKCKESSKAKIKNEHKSLRVCRHKLIDAVRGKSQCCELFHNQGCTSENPHSSCWERRHIPIIYNRLPRKATSFRCLSQASVNGSVGSGNPIVVEVLHWKHEAPEWTINEKREIYQNLKGNKKYTKPLLVEENNIIHSRSMQCHACKIRSMRNQDGENGVRSGKENYILDCEPSKRANSESYVNPSDILDVEGIVLSRPEFGNGASDRKIYTNQCNSFECESLNNLSATNYKSSTFALSEKMANISVVNGENEDNENVSGSDDETYISDRPTHYSRGDNTSCNVKVSDSGIGTLNLSHKNLAYTHVSEGKTEQSKSCIANSGTVISIEKKTTHLFSPVDERKEKDVPLSIEEQTCYAIAPESDIDYDSSCYYTINTDVEDTADASLFTDQLDGIGFTYLENHFPSTPARLDDSFSDICASTPLATAPAHCPYYYQLAWLKQNDDVDPNIPTHDFVHEFSGNEHRIPTLGNKGERTPLRVNLLKRLHAFKDTHAPPNSQSCLTMSSSERRLSKYEMEAQKDVGNFSEKFINKSCDDSHRQLSFSNTPQENLTASKACLMSEINATGFPDFKEACLVSDDNANKSSTNNKTRFSSEITKKECPINNKTYFHSKIGANVFPNDHESSLTSKATNKSSTSNKVCSATGALQIEQPQTSHQKSSASEWTIGSCTTELETSLEISPVSKETLDVEGDSETDNPWIYD